MDCEEVDELLHAYALGAVEKGEARAVEEHVADCLRCWRELTDAQRAAALLALAVPLERASPSLRERVIASARRSDRWARLRELFGGLRRFWPVGVGALAVSTAAALSLVVVLETQVNDLDDQNDRLQSQIQSAGTVLGRQQQMLALVSVPDVHNLALTPDPSEPEAEGTYYWSEALHRGAIVCNKLPRLAAGQTYQLWILVDNEAVSAGTFSSWNGIGQYAFNYEALHLKQLPTGVAVSIEPATDSTHPSGEVVLSASFQQR